MIRNGYNSLSRKTALASAALAAFLASGSGAYAGKTDLETGEQCWGTGCIDAGDQELPGGSGSNDPGSSGPILLSNITTEDCSDAAARRISNSVAWLQNNMSAIDATMQGSNILMFWPGNSRENFEEKLHKDLEFACINGKNKCDRLWGRTVPVIHQKRVALCTNSIDDGAGHNAARMDQLYIHVIAHEIGHLVRLNGHAGNCGFSYALGYAAEYGFRGIPYQAASTGPCRDPFGFDIDDKLSSGNMDKPLTLED